MSSQFSSPPGAAMELETPPLSLSSLPHDLIHLVLDSKLALSDIASVACCSTYLRFVSNEFLRAKKRLVGEVELRESSSPLYWAAQRCPQLSAIDLGAAATDGARSAQLRPALIARLDSRSTRSPPPGARARTVRSRPSLR